MSDLIYADSKKVTSEFFGKGKLKGSVCLMDSGEGIDIIVELDNYYSYNTIKETFGNIVFTASDYLESSPPDMGFEFFTFKKFRIESWALTKEN